MNVKIALLGCGTVGSGFLEILKRQAPLLKEQFDLEYEIVGVLVRQLDKYSEHPLHAIMTTHFDVIMDKQPDLVIEVMGGIEPTKAYIETAIAGGCHVITANKDLLAAHGAALFALAQSRGVTIGFEASVGGGIPVIKPLKDSLRYAGLRKVSGIVNGTCNYILSRMTEDDLSYQEALAEAMACGFAESNPHADVSGLDSARKLCVLATLAFSKSVTPDCVKTNGIENVDAANILLAKVNGMKIKLVAFSTSQDNQIYSVVQPCIVSPCHAFYNIDQEYNSIELRGSDFGVLHFSGKGAGKYPTGTAIFSDFIDYLSSKKDKASIYSADKAFTSLSLNPDAACWILQMTNNPSADELGRILQTFSDHRLSIQQHPEVAGMQLEIEDMLEKELLERLSLLAEWCPDVKLLPLVKLC